MTEASKIQAVKSGHFKPGDKVRVDDRDVAGHCRSPWYLRGQAGVIAEVLGTFRDPERLAYHRPGLPQQVLYKVRFKQAALWRDYQGPAKDQLEADIAENWLLAEPVGKASAKKSAAR
jgi:nitrile hydratase subunit beta